MEAFKLLAIITNSKEGIALADGIDLLLILSSIIEKENLSDEILTQIIITLKHCMLSEKAINQLRLPWSELSKLLVQKAYTKEKNLLQRASIQALRIMSDKPEVKEELNQLYKTKIREIPCLDKEAEALKDDLVQWLTYRNYKPNDSSKYSKLFI